MRTVHDVKSAVPSKHPMGCHLGFHDWVVCQTDIDDQEFWVCPRCGRSEALHPMHDATLEGSMGSGWGMHP